MQELEGFLQDLLPRTYFSGIKGICTLLLMNVDSE